MRKPDWAFFFGPIPFSAATGDGRNAELELFNNTTHRVLEDLAGRIRKGGRVSVAASCFSLYAYEALKKELEGCAGMRFLFTSPTFVAEKTPKERRQFYISRLEREKSLYGTEFEVRLRNELAQKAVARECAEWIRRKASFRTNTTRDGMNSFLVVDNPGDVAAYSPFNAFTTVELGCERGGNLTNFVVRADHAESAEFLRSFDAIWNDPEKLSDVTDAVVASIASVYRENAPELVYFAALRQIFSDFLADVSEDDLPNEATGFRDSAVWRRLYDFQRDAALAIIHKLEQFDGCILADSVGLGKTFTALAVVKYYEGRNKSVLVLCPKKLSENWLTYRGNLVDNPLAADRLRYDVLFHTDLSRDSGTGATGLLLDRVNWGNYDLVVIDESHNFRNGIGTESHGGERENRFLRLVNRIVRPGVKTKVLMLSATPVNNRFSDLRNQLVIASGGDVSALDGKLGTGTGVNEIFRRAQRTYNEWCRLPEPERTTPALLDRLDPGFFDLLDAVTIARSRRHVREAYASSGVGSFPERRPPVSLRPCLTRKPGAINYHEVFEQLQALHLTIYTPIDFVQASRRAKYLGDAESESFRRGRERGVQRLMAINLLKRMESSVHSFLLTVRRIRAFMDATSAAIDRFRASARPAGGGGGAIDVRDLSGGGGDFDDDDRNTDFFDGGRQLRIDLADMNYVSWQRDIDADRETLALLESMVADISPADDEKLQALLRLVREKVRAPFNPGNRKVLVFTAFADTAEYLYEHLSAAARGELGLHAALVTGSVDGRTTVPGFRPTFSSVLSAFSPVSKERAAAPGAQKADIDILVATDCISEGQNLQDCDFCVNYDIHWNPVRIIQRFGRIDRIGSRNSSVQLVNFWPDLDLDEYINLKSRVETRMRIATLSATGDDDLVNAAEKGDLAYRREQLRRLREEVVDLEDMAGGVSITDLGLGEFRSDLVAWEKAHPGMERVPPGIHAVVPGAEPGALFVLRNRNAELGAGGRNRLHPYYLVRVSADGRVLASHLRPKDALDAMRRLCRGRAEPVAPLCDRFNRETRDGRDMRRVSRLLEAAVASIVERKDESDAASFFAPVQTTFLARGFAGLDDFELLCFLAIEPEGRA